MNTGAQQMNTGAQQMKKADLLVPYGLKLMHRGLSLLEAKARLRKLSSKSMEEIKKTVQAEAALTDIEKGD